jgi:hypothetical protein
MRAVPRLCKFYPGICLTTEEKERKNLSQGRKKTSVRLRKPSVRVQYTYEGNSISKLQIQVATYVFELSAGNCHR